MDLLPRTLKSTLTKKIRSKWRARKSPIRKKSWKPLKKYWFRMMLRLKSSRLKRRKWTATTPLARSKTSRTKMNLRIVTIKNLVFNSSNSTPLRTNRNLAVKLATTEKILLMSSSKKEIPSQKTTSRGQSLLPKPPRKPTRDKTISKDLKISIDSKENKEKSPFNSSLILKTISFLY